MVNGFQKLAPTDGSRNYDYFGSTISISADGNTLVAGSFGDGDNGPVSGSIYILTRNETSWYQQAKLLASDGRDSTSAYFGQSVSMSADGNTVLSGAYGDDNNGEASGAAYIYVRENSEWSEAIKLTAIDGSAYDYFGRHVSLSADGTTAVIGASGVDGVGVVSGAAYVWRGFRDSWKLVPSDNASADRFGCSTSTSSNGSTVIVGAYGSSQPGNRYGSAYIFVFNGTSYEQQAKLVASEESLYSTFGGSVALSRDGNTAAVGCYTRESNQDRGFFIYVFTRQGTTWFEQSKFQPSDSGSVDYGRVDLSISTEGNKILLGANYEYENEEGVSASTGVAYVFKQQNDTHWDEEHKFSAKDGSFPYTFGSSVSITADGNAVAVGAYKDTVRGNPTGSVYVSMAGYRYVDGTVRECEIGSYCPIGTTSNTTACPGGYYCPTTASIFICSEGHYCPEASSVQIKCPVGVECPKGSSSFDPLPLPSTTSSHSFSFSSQLTIAIVATLSVVSLGVVLLCFIGVVNTIIFALSIGNFFTDILYVSLESFSNATLQWLCFAFVLTPALGFFLFFPPSKDLLLCGWLSLIPWGEAREGESFCARMGHIAWFLVGNITLLIFKLVLWPILLALGAGFGFLLFATKLLALPSVSSWFMSLWRIGTVAPANNSEGLTAPWLKDFNLMLLTELILECIPQLAIQITNNGSKDGLVALLSISFSVVVVAIHLPTFVWYTSKRVPLVEVPTLSLLSKDTASPSAEVELEP